MDIERATASDCRGIAEVHVASWQRAYVGVIPSSYLASLSVSERESMWRRMVEQHPSGLFVARTSGGLVGFVAVGPCRDEAAPPDRAEVWAIYVRPEYWSTGAGRQLWLSALQQLRADGYNTVSLWVIANNQRAIAFYERAGFVVEPESRKQFELAGVTIEEVRYVRGTAG